MSHWRPRVKTGVSTAAAVKTLAGPGAAGPDDSYLAKVVTYIPAETIAAYQAVVGFVPSDGSQYLAYFACFLVIFTPIWLLFATTQEGERWAWYQALVGFVAFLVWLLVVKSPFWDWVWSGSAQIPGYARSMILIAATLLFPLIEKILKRLGIVV